MPRSAPTGTTGPVGSSEAVSRPTARGRLCRQTAERASARRRHRLRHEMEHPAAPGALGCRVTVVPGRSTGRRSSRPEPDGVFLSNGPGDPRPLSTRRARSAPAWARNRSSASAWGISSWAWPGREDLQAEVRPPRRQPAGARSPKQPGRDHQPEPRFRARGRLASRNVEVTHINLNDQTLEGIRHRDFPGLQRAVPSRSLGRPSRQQLFVPEFCDLIGPNAGNGRADSSLIAVRRGIFDPQH